MIVQIIDEEAINNYRLLCREDIKVVTGLRLWYIEKFIIETTETCVMHIASIMSLNFNLGNSNTILWIFELFWVC